MSLSSVKWAAPSNDVAVRVLHQLISGTPGIQAGLGQVRKRLNKIMRGLGKHRLKSERVCSPESVALRLGSPFFLPNATSYPEILTVKQQAKADAANAKTEAARPGRANLFFCQCTPSAQYLIRPTPPSLPAAVCTAPVPCGAAEEGPGLDVVAPNDLSDPEIEVLTKAIDFSCASS